MNRNLPKYMFIRAYIKNMIDTSQWREGDLIPTEKELMHQFAVSRTTIRKALDSLVKEKYLLRKAGYGTTVNAEQPSLLNFTLVQSATNEMREMGMPTKTLNAKLEMIESNELLSSIFKVTEKTKLYHLVRTRGTSGPLMYSDTYLLPIIEIPNTTQVLYGSLYEYLAEKNVAFGYFEEFVSAVHASYEIKKIFDDDELTPQLKRKRFSYDITGKLIECTETYYRAQNYEYRTKIYHQHFNVL